MKPISEYTDAELEFSAKYPGFIGNLAAEVLRLRRELKIMEDIHHTDHCYTENCEWCEGIYQ